MWVEGGVGDPEPRSPALPSLPGGVVVFAVNSLLYLNQSVPPYGVALNSLTTGTTAFPLREWG